MKSILGIFKDLKFRKKILLSYLLVSIVPISILGIFCYQQTTALLLSQEKTNLQTSLQQACGAINNQLEIYNSLSDYLAFDADLMEAANRTYNSYLELYDVYTNTITPTFLAMKNLHDGVDHITLYSGTNVEPHGDMVLPIAEIHNEPWFDQAMDSAGINWICDESAQTVFSARRIPGLADGKESKKNLLCIALNYDMLFQSCQELLQNQCGIYLVDVEQTVLFQQYNSDEEPPAVSLLQNGEGSVSWKQTEYAMIRADIPACGWQAILYKPTHLITDAASPIVLTVLCMICICLVVILLMGGLLSRAVVSRIEKLRKNMQQVVETGNMTVFVNSRSKDEVGDLIRSFQKMIARINLLINEVYKEKLAQKEAELKALQAQINPHFLYNCLSLINWRAIRTDATDISEIAQLLSSFYRTTLNKGKNLTSVENELRNIRSYLDIQLIMHSHQFTVHYEIDDWIYPYTMLNLLLQPLVENAVIHGIDQKPEGTGCIRIVGRQEKNAIIFQVEDNGVGMDAAVVSHLLEKDTGGYGLRNVQERIQLYYGKEYGLFIQSTPNCGTTITLTIPAQTDSLGS